MIASTADPLLAGLAALATDAPGELMDRIVARWTRAPGPVGELSVAFTDHGVAYIGLDGESFAGSFRERFARPLLPAERLPAGLLHALRFGRTTGLRFDLRGLSGFQRDVLLAARTIPRGQVRPYSWIAQEVGRPKAVRAVGTALGRNPVPVLIPCHRVTRSDGRVGDYVFGSGVKETLLDAEGVDLAWIRRLAKDNVFYLGNETSRVVCFPTCDNTRRVASDHHRGFRTLREALAASYRPCGACRPAREDTA